MSEYTEKADKFMEKTKTEMKVTFSHYGKHFPDDKEKRDVYTIALYRKDHTYIFDFGQSIVNSKTDAFKKRTKPTAYDVLTCLTKYDPGTFDDFCAEYGYDTDSRKAETIYFAVQKEFANVNKLFSDVMNELQEIQ